MQELGHGTTGGAGVALIDHVVHEVFIGLNNLKHNYTTVLQPQRPFMNSEIKLRKALPSHKYHNSKKKFYCESKTNKGISNSEHPKFYAHLPHGLLVVMTLLFLLGCCKPCAPRCGLGSGNFGSCVHLFARFLLLH